MVAIGPTPFIRQKTSGEQVRSQGTPGYASQFFGGVALGIENDTIGGLLLHTLGDIGVGPDRESMNALRYRMRDRDLASAGEFIGEYGTMILGIIPAVRAGQLVGTASLNMIARRSVAKGMSVRGVGTLGSVVAKMEDIGGSMGPKVFRKLKIERAAEIVGAAAGEGVLFAGRGLIEGEGLRGALQQGALAAATGAVAETAMTLSAVALFKRSRAIYVDQASKLDSFETPGVVANHIVGVRQGISARQVLEESVVSARQGIDNVNKAIDELMSVTEQHIELVKLKGTKSHQVLAAIQASPNATPQELAAKLGMPTSTMTSLVRHLENKKLVRATKTSELVPGPPKRRLSKADLALKRSGLLPAVMEERMLKESGKNIVKVLARYKITRKALSKVKTQRIRQAEELNKQEQKLLAGLMTQGRGATKTLQAAEERLATPSTVLLPSTRPKGFTALRRTFITALRPLLLTPNGLSDEFGEIGARAMQATFDMDNALVARMAENASEVRRLFKQTIKAAGVSARAAHQGALLPFQHHFELGSLDPVHKGLRGYAISQGITGKRLEDLIDGFERLSEFESTWHKLVMTVGGKPELQLKSYGVERFLTHVSETLGEDDLVKSLTKLYKDNPQAAVETIEQALMDPLEAAEVAEIAAKAGIVGAENITDLGQLAKSVDVKVLERLVNQIYKRGPSVHVDLRMSRYGAFDHTRTIRGTALDKVNAGLPVIKNPFEAGLQYAHAAARRVGLASVFGSKGQLFDTFVDAVQAEGGDHLLFKKVLTEYLNVDHHNDFLRATAQWATSVNVASKMGLGFIANLTQPQNLLMQFGLMRTVKGLSSVLGGETRKNLAASLALQHSMLDDIGRVSGEEGLAVGAFQKVANFVLKLTGFTGIEKMNRIWAGGTGIAVAKDLIMKGANGRLRGDALTRARRMASDLSFDLDTVLDTVRVYNPDKTLNKLMTAENTARYLNNEGQGVLYKAAWRSAQLTQFIPTRFTRPPAWNHPIGRIMTQFKTFALHQSRLIRDAVAVEASAGNLAPLAYFLGAVGISGEAVTDAKKWFAGKDRVDDPLARQVENLFGVGALGMVLDLYQSGFYGGALEFVAGPSASTANSLITSMFRGDADSFVKEFAEAPTARLVTRTLGAAIMNKDSVLEYMDHDFEDTPGTSAAFRLAPPPAVRVPMRGSLDQTDLARQRVADKAGRR